MPMPACTSSPRTAAALPARGSPSSSGLASGAALRRTGDPTSARAPVPGRTDPARVSRAGGRRGRRRSPAACADAPAAPAARTAATTYRPGASFSSRRRRGAPTAGSGRTARAEGGPDRAPTWPDVGLDVVPRWPARPRYSRAGCMCSPGRASWSRVVPGAARWSHGWCGAVCTAAHLAVYRLPRRGFATQTPSPRIPGPPGEVSCRRSSVLIDGSTLASRSGRAPGRLAAARRSSA
jgi:hypothetical protein